MGNHPSNTEHVFTKLFKECFLYYNPNTGRVWRLKLYNRWAKRGFIILKNARKAEHITKQGYLQLRITLNGKTYHCMAHRAIYDNFVKTIPSGCEINHKDGNKQNNRLNNLELVTSGENQKHAYKTGLRTCNNKRDICTGKFIKRIGSIHNNPELLKI